MKVYLLIYIDNNCECMDRLVPCGIYSTKELAQQQIDQTKLLFPNYVCLTIVETDLDRDIAMYRINTEAIDCCYPAYITELGNMEN